MTDGFTNIPDFLVVGAAKSGTSSLHSYLSKHPDIYMPEKRKELYFWHILTNANRSIVDHLGAENIPTSLEEYLDYFSDAKPGQITGEACPSYLYFREQVLENLKKYHSNWRDTRIVIILREPVSRIVSEYRFICKHSLDPESLSFSESLKAEPLRLAENKLLPDLFYKKASMYCEQVKFYQDNFKNVRVYLFDDLKDKPAELLDDLCLFLGIDEKKLPSFHFEAVNSSSGARKLKYPAIMKTARMLLRWLPDSVKKKLSNVGKKVLTENIEIPDYELTRLKDSFREEITCLEKILNRDLTAWKAG